MSLKLISLLIIFITFFTEAFGIEPITILKDNEVFSLNQNIEVLEDPSNQYTFSTIYKNSSSLPFHPIDQTDYSSPNHWIRFTIQNSSEGLQILRLAVTFTDSIFLYSKSIEGNYTQTISGDLVKLGDRDNYNGQLCYLTLFIDKDQRDTIYVKLQSNTAISLQFKKYTFSALKLYELSYNEKQDKINRYFQSFFYGALIIMLLYNLMIGLILRSVNYFYYSLFILCILLFFVSNGGFLVELFFYNHPRIDLYIRFFSLPILMISFLWFTSHYLKIESFEPRFKKYILFLIILFVILLAIMITGHWKTGRNISIITAIVSFIFILLSGIAISKKGFRPARYFLIANILLLIGGCVFAVDRFLLIRTDSFLQYAVQFSCILQTALFSIGLAERIKLAESDAAHSKFEIEKTERIREAEKKKLIEERNLMLEKVNKDLNTFIYKTAHDIKGPVATLVGLSEIGLKDSKDPVSIEYLKRLNLTSQKLNQIIIRLQNIYQLSNAEIKMEEIHFEKMIEEIKSELSNEEFKTVELNLEDYLLSTFQSDAKIVKLILFILIENSYNFRIKANNHQTKIDILITSINSKVLIRIIDNGTGIDPQEAPFIFDVFSKAALIHKTPGLGLFMAKTAADRLGGTIELVTSERGRTEFKVTLPQS